MSKAKKEEKKKYDDNDLIGLFSNLVLVSQQRRELAMTTNLLIKQSKLLDKQISKAKKSVDEYDKLIKETEKFLNSAKLPRTAWDALLELGYCTRTWGHVRSTKQLLGALRDATGMDIVSDIDTTQDVKHKFRPGFSEEWDAACAVLRRYGNKPVPQRMNPYKSLAEEGKAPGWTAEK